MLKQHVSWYITQSGFRVAPPDLCPCIVASIPFPRSSPRISYILIPILELLSALHLLDWYQTSVSYITTYFLFPLPLLKPCPVLLNNLQPLRALYSTSCPSHVATWCLFLVSPYPCLHFCVTTQSPCQVASVPSNTNWSSCPMLVFWIHHSQPLCCKSVIILHVVTCCTLFFCPLQVLPDTHYSCHCPIPITMICVSKMFSKSPGIFRVPIQYVLFIDYNGALHTGKYLYMIYIFEPFSVTSPDKSRTVV